MKKALLVFILAAAPLFANEPPPLDPKFLPELVEQLHGGDCDYKFGYVSNVGEVCRERMWTEKIFFFIPEHKLHTCVMWAAQCIEPMGAAAKAAVPDLTKALLEGPNDFDTGDGTVDPRSAIVKTLGTIGDTSAIPALISALENARPYDTDKVTGAIKTNEPAARYAIMEALAKFGPAAKTAAPALMKVLHERNEKLKETDPHEKLLQMQEQTKKHSPNGPVWPDTYLTDYEAAGAAVALGKIGATESIDLLIDTLDDRWATEGAAQALGLLGEPAKKAAPALQKVLTSSEYEPEHKVAAAEALARLKITSAIPTLTKNIGEPKLRRGYAKALGLFGAAANSAVPALKRELSKPTGGVQTETGIKYDAAATTALMDRDEIAGALQTINTPEAFDALATFLTNPEMARKACYCLLQMDPSGEKVRRAVAKLGSRDEIIARRPPLHIKDCLDR